MKNEEGFILPAILGIILILATLLVMIASQIEVKSASYERTQNIWRLNLLEREGLLLLEERLQIRAADENRDDFSETIPLRRGSTMNVEVNFSEESVEIAYRVVYNGFVRVRRVNYETDQGFVFTNH